MSHVAQIELEIKDLDALETVCTELGLELVRDQRTYNWYGRSVGDSALPVGFAKEELGTCEHAIRIKGSKHVGAANSRMPYEIGLARCRDGRNGYVMLWDTWMGGNGLVEKVGGEKATKLRQGYGVEVAVRQMKRDGHRFVKKEMKDGKATLVFQR
jgi:hypothetical protein